MLQQAFANGSSKNDENVTFLKKKYPKFDF